MAKTLNKDPWVWTAAGDAEGQIHGGSFQLPIYVRQIKVDTGDGGDFLLTTASTSDTEAVGYPGERLLKLDNTPANDTLWVEIETYWDNIFIQTLPANASIEIYHGRGD